MYAEVTVGAVFLFFAVFFFDSINSATIHLVPKHFLELPYFEPHFLYSPLHLV
jgi:hypothetical protein